MPDEEKKQSLFLTGKYKLIDKEGYINSSCDKPTGHNKGIVDYINEGNHTYSIEAPADLIFNIFKVEDGFGYIQDFYSCSITPEEWKYFSLIESDEDKDVV
jgi:hypothetical protein